MINLKTAVLFLMLVVIAVTTDCRAAFVVKSKSTTNSAVPPIEQSHSFQNSGYGFSNFDRRYDRNYRNHNKYHNYQTHSNTNLSFTSFALSLLGIITFFLAFAVGSAATSTAILLLALTPICGLLAILFGAFGMREKSNTGLAIVGLVIGIIELAVGGLAALLVVALAGM